MQHLIVIDVVRHERHERLMMTPGQAAYKKWSELCIPRVEMPWDTLGELATNGWEKIAEAAINQHIDDRDALEQGYERETFGW